MGGDGPTFIMDLYAEKHPEIILIPMFYDDFEMEDRKTIYSFCRFLTINNTVINLFKTMTYNLLLNDEDILTVECKPLDLYMSHLVYVDFNLIDTDDIYDDIKECLFIKCSKYKNGVYLDKVLEAIEYFMENILDVNGTLMNKFYRRLNEIEPNVANFVILKLVTHIYLTYFIRYINNNKNQNKLIERYIYKYKLLEVSGK